MKLDRHFWSIDLVAVVLYVVVVDVLVLGIGLSGSLLRTGLVLPLAVFLPGYALVSLVFPERYGEARQTVARRASSRVDPEVGERGIPPLARLLLGVTASIVVVPLVVAAESFVVGIYLRPVLVGVSALTIAFCLWALAARLRLSPTERFDVRAFWPWRSGRRTPGGPSSRSLRGPLTILLVVSMLSMAGSVAFAAALPLAGISGPESSDHTEFYLVTESDNGTYVMDDYPQQFEPGESRPLFVAIENHDTDATRYTVVATLQRIERVDGQEQVASQTELERFEERVEGGETVHLRHDVEPPARGDNLRLVYLLYEGDPPSNPSMENANQKLQLWITVDGGGGNQSSIAPPREAR